MCEHKHKLVPGFTSTYGVSRLVHVETFATVDDAIAREKEIKGWRREKKVRLIEAKNPKWWDLSHGWYDDADSFPSAKDRPCGAGGSLAPLRDDRSGA
jgi:putative endonuclease